MPRKKLRQPSNARRSKKTNITNAPSTTSAETKSKRSVKFYTPSNASAEFLRDAGLVVPELQESGEVELPFDLTGVSSRELGQQHSHWAIRHGYALYVAAQRQTSLQAIDHEIRMRRAAFVALHGSDFKTKFGADAAFDAESENEEILLKKLELEMEVTVVNALCQSYEGYRNAASREMSRRLTEQAPRD